MKLEFKTAGGFTGGFVAEYEGYLCFITGQAFGGEVGYSWSIQEGGGWTSRGGENVKVCAEGLSMSASIAEESIIEWVDENCDD